MGQSVCDKTIHAVNEYLSRNYKMQPWKTRLIILKNPSYLSQYYYLKTGVHFSDNLLKIRMERAAVLLDNYRYKIKEVSEMVGYMNAKNFTKAFKKYYGKLPRDYRQNI